jgi:hypothetical protein
MGLRRGWIWYLAGLLLAVMAGVLAVLALRQAVPKVEPIRTATRPVIVARQMAARQILSQEALATRDRRWKKSHGAVFRIEVNRSWLAPLRPRRAGSCDHLINIGGAAAKLVAVVLPAVDLLSQSGERNIKTA